MRRRLGTDERELSKIDRVRLARTALRTAENFGHAPSHEGAEGELAEALSVPSIRRWAAYSQAAVKVLDNELTSSAWKRAREASSRLRLLVRSSGLPDDPLVALLEVVDFDDLPPIEDVDAAIRRQTEACEFADASLDLERLKRQAARKASQQVEHRWVNGRWQRRQTVAEAAAARLPAAEARARRAGVAVAARRRPTCSESPRRRTRTRPRGAGRPGRRRGSRAHAPPGDEPEPEAPAPDDVDVAAGAFA